MAYGNEKLHHYRIEDKDRRLVSTLVLLNWLQCVLLLPSLGLIQAFYEYEELHIAAAFICLGIYVFIAVAVSVAAIHYARRRTWESLANSCFIFWLAPLWIWVVTQAPTLLLLYSAVPVATIIVTVRIYRDYLK